MLLIEENICATQSLQTGYSGMPPVVVAMSTISKNVRHLRVWEVTCRAGQSCCEELMTRKLRFDCGAIMCVRDTKGKLSLILCGARLKCSERKVTWCPGAKQSISRETGAACGPAPGLAKPLHCENIQRWVRQETKCWRLGRDEGAADASLNSPGEIGEMRAHVPIKNRRHRSARVPRYTERHSSVPATSLCPSAKHAALI